MSVLATDNFNRANETPLSGGGNWSLSFGDNPWDLSGNVVVPRVVNSDCVMHYTAGTWPNDQYSKADLTVTATVGGDQGVGLTVRGTTAATTYYRAVADHAASGNVSISKMVNGVYTTLVNGTFSWTDGATWEFRAQGTTLTFLCNGVTVLTTTDSSIAGGKPGIALSSNVSSASLDNWEGGDVSSGTVATPGTAAMTLTTFPPTVTATNNKTAIPGLASLILTTFAPSLILGTVSTPSTATLTLTTLAPSIVLGTVSTPGTTTLTLTTFAPTISTPVSATPSTAGLTMTTFVPTVTASNQQTAIPDSASLGLTAFAPTVTVNPASVTCTPDPISLLLTSLPPTVEVSIDDLPVIIIGGDDAPRRTRRRRERTFHDFARELEATIHGLLHPAPVDDRQETPPPSLSPDAAERALNELVVLAHGQHARLQQVAALRTDLHEILAARDRMLEQDEEDALIWLF